MNKLIIIAVLFGCALPNLSDVLADASPAKEADTTLVENLEGVLPALSMQGKIVGMEINPLCKQKLSISSLGSIAAINLVEFAKVIEKQTDYNIITGPDYFLILPKSDAARYAKSLAVRQVKFDPISSDSVYKVCAKIQSADQGGSFALFPDIFANPLDISHGTLNLTAGNCACFKYLNKVAQQLGARFWTINDLVISRKGEKTPEFPVTQSVGYVAFRK